MEIIPCLGHFIYFNAKSLCWKYVTSESNWRYMVGLYIVIQAGAHLTKDFSIAIQIRWTIHLGLCSTYVFDPYDSWHKSQQQSCSAMCTISKRLFYCNFNESRIYFASNCDHYGKGKLIREMDLYISITWRQHPIRGISAVFILSAKPQRMWFCLLYWSLWVICELMSLCETWIKG